MVSILVTFFLFQFLKEMIKVCEQNGPKVIIEVDPVQFVISDSFNRALSQDINSYIVVSALIPVHCVVSHSLKSSVL